MNRFKKNRMQKKRRAAGGHPNYLFDIADDGDAAFQSLIADLNAHQITAASDSIVAQGTASVRICVLPATSAVFGENTCTWSFEARSALLSPNTAATPPCTKTVAWGLGNTWRRRWSSGAERRKSVRCCS